ncbi:unnamed protein product [Pelagomonas calceolata]|uniref:Uncharacterized protein n=1 Tax=Pelagomonas calceolata TaxID=35677 RepID=A0A8J2STS5_9STRA|nr:unnamed protein product [Pelagomonas calceolata]
MFKKRTLKGQKKATAPKVDAPAEDTAAALDDAKFAQEARKRARGLSAQALVAPKPTKAEEAPKEPAADADALGGLGRDFGASHTGASAAAAVHEKALEEYLANQEAPAEPAPAPAASRDDALYAVPKLEGLEDVSKDAERAFAKGGTHGFGVTGTAEVEVETDSAANARLCAEEAAKRRRAVNALPVSSAILPEDRERMLELPPDHDESLIGKRGPHLWRRGDPAEERRKAQRRGRAERCR